MEIGDALKKAVLAGVGAVATTVEVAGEVIDTLSKKGEETMEQGKVINEELKRNAKEKIKEHVTINIVKETIDLESLTKEEREVVKKKLDELEKEEAKKTENDEPQEDLKEESAQEDEMQVELVETEIKYNEEVKADSDAELTGGSKETEHE